LLSQIEDKVARAQKNGSEAVRALGHQTIFIWLAKIFFGILYKEALLPYQRSNPEAGPIIPKEAINSFDSLHRFMQTARTGLDFTSPDTNFHTSIMVFNIQKHPNIRGRFNYIDGIPEGFLGIYFDTIGLVLILDGGAQERLANETMPKIFQQPLHPIQFVQLCSLYMTKARTFTRTPKYIFASSPAGLQVAQMPLQGLSQKPLFGEFDYKEYAWLFSQFTSIPFSKCYDENQGVIDFIHDYDAPRYIDVTTSPWPEFKD
jgi:hypothetical protein